MKPRLGVADVAELAQRTLLRSQTTQGRADVELALELQAIESEYDLGPGATALFQQLLGRLGLTSQRPIALPPDSLPYWLRGAQSLANYQSHAALPESADVVIIGAGLTGASTAYHLAAAVRAEGRRVVVLDQGDPAGEASGRNGGNFELIPENCVGLYEGLAHERLRFLQRCYADVPMAVLHAESERQASSVFRLALRNRDRFKSIIKQEGIACDFSPRGWLYLAHNEREEQALCEEVSLAAQHGQRIELWSRRRIRQEFGFNAPYLGRFIPGDGTYHPFKYVCGLLHCALRAGVELYTRRRVLGLLNHEQHVEVVTESEVIRAVRVVVATNAFTSRLIPELGAIRPFQSQIMLTEHAPDRARGRVVTSEYGPTFLNQPRGGLDHGRAPLLLGGGADRPMRNPWSRRRSARIHARLLQLRDAFYPELTGQPPTAEWIGAMGFTPDQLPAIGFLSPRVVIAAGFNGYGGSYTTAAGEAAALMSVRGETPEWVPEDVFSPRRFLTEEPLFMRSHESLWRIAAALCQQLRGVEAQISETLEYGRSSPADRRPAARRVSAGIQIQSASSCPEMDAKHLQALPLFRAFSCDELVELVKMTRRWEAPRGALLFREGSPGGSCFIVLSGLVGVSASAGSRWLASMSPGSIFGQVSLIDGDPRSASCFMREAGVLLEMEDRACAELFAKRNPLALKFLAALNHGLIIALRGADRRLLRLARRDEIQLEAAPSERETILF